MLKKCVLFVAVSVAGVSAMPIAAFSASPAQGAVVAAGDSEGSDYCAAVPVRTVDYVRSDGSRSATPQPGAATEYRYGGEFSGTRQVIPPAGWTPLESTDAQLQLYGFPPRPSAVQTAARAEWDHTFATWKGSARPGLCVTDKSNGTPSENWSGNELSSVRNSYLAISGRFTEPTFVAGCAHASSHAIWSGIGGDGADAGLIQTGTDTGSDLSSIYAWYEVLSSSPDYDTKEVKTGLSIPSGHDVRASVNYSAPSASIPTGEATFTVTDITVGTSAIVSVDSVDNGAYNISAFVRGGTAEWIDERPTNKSLTYPVDGQYYYLRQPSPATTTWSSASVNSGTVLSITDPHQFSIDMVRPAPFSNVLENGGDPVNIHGGFYDHWDACA